MHWAPTSFPRPRSRKKLCDARSRNKMRLNLKKIEPQRDSATRLKVWGNVNICHTPSPTIPRVKMKKRYKIYAGRADNRNSHSHRTALKRSDRSLDTPGHTSNTPVYTGLYTLNCPKNTGEHRKTH